MASPVIRRCYASPVRRRSPDLGPWRVLPWGSGSAPLEHDDREPPVGLLPVVREAGAPFDLSSVERSSLLFVLILVAGTGIRLGPLDLDVRVREEVEVPVGIVGAPPLVPKTT